MKFRHRFNESERDRASDLIARETARALARARHEEEENEHDE